MARVNKIKDTYKRFRHELTDRKRYYSKKYKITFDDLPASPFDSKGRDATDEDYNDAIQQLIYYAQDFEERLIQEKGIKVGLDKKLGEPDKGLSARLSNKHKSDAEELKEFPDLLPAFHDLAIQRFYESLNVADNVVGASILSEAMVSIEENIGSEAFAQMLEDAENAGVHFETWMAYDEGKVELYIDELTSFLNTVDERWIARDTARSIYDAYEYEGEI